MDKHAVRRKRMANYEEFLMLQRYPSECIDFPPRMETNEEKQQRLKRETIEREREQRLKTQFEDYARRKLNDC